MRSVLRILGGGLAALVAALTANAHDPFEITAAVRLQGDGLEIRLTMAKSAAAIAGVEGATAPKPFSDDVFDEMQRRMLMRAGRLFALRLTGLELPVVSSDVVLTPESDVEFILRYARPPAGGLMIDAAFLPLLPDPAFGATVTVHAENGALLGQKFLNAEDHVLRFGVPESSAVAPVATGSRLGNDPAHRAAAAETLKKNAVRLLIVCAALVLVFVAAWVAVRRRMLRG